VVVGVDEVVGTDKVVGTDELVRAMSSRNPGTGEELEKDSRVKS
jgi:hypothetical protein